MHHDDTIVAISSPAAPAARIIVRLSGRGAIAISKVVCPNLQDEPASARRMVLRWNGLAVPAWVYLFRGPRSYSGEDIVEFHIPGNPVLARMLLESLMRVGARAAEPGEFTARAVFNGRMDLSAAEGVAAVISAASERELRAARQLLSGGLAVRVRPIMDELATTLAMVEVGIDFSDEDVTVLSDSELYRSLAAIVSSLGNLLKETARMERLGIEPRVVLVGRPNAGKSTLLNALAGGQRAVVSDMPGTTRDALSAPVDLPRGRVLLIDLAGLDSAVPSGTDPAIAADMQRRAREELERADVVVLVRDSTEMSQPLPLPRQPDLVIWTKGDLARPTGGLTVSAPSGEGLAELRRRLDERCFGGPASPVLALNSRHVLAIEDALSALGQTGDLAGSEIVALSLREALDCLGAIIGQVVPDEILGRVFARFCVGK